MSVSTDEKYSEKEAKARFEGALRGRTEHAPQSSKGQAEGESGEEGQ